MDTSGANPIPELLQVLYDGILTVSDGEVATYIPELTGADPGWFGLALATIDGHVYSYGECDREFTIQSVSKPFVYALALADRGLDEVLTRVGVEPSGESFNAISLEPGTGRPANPMVNAGAILTTSLVKGGFDRILGGLSAFAGRPLVHDPVVYASEQETGDRNRALAYLMRNAGALQSEVDEALAAYFQQCSVLVSAQDLALMSVTLANGGIQPLTGETVVDRDTAAHVLTVMATCGMYDFAGEWLLRVGLPAKSGVSGGIAAALPAQLGIGVFSPPLDARGNSVRGIAACEELSARFGLHVMRPVVRTASAVYLRRTLRGMRSSAERTAKQWATIRDAGRAVVIRGLQGDIEFTAAESLVRTLAAGLTEARWLVLDLGRVTSLHPVALRLLVTLTDRLTGLGIVTVVVDGHDRGLIHAAQVRFPALDEALVWCEDQVLNPSAPPLEDTPPTKPARNARKTRQQKRRRH
ncbi:glutaminase A [Hamadaea tsunoensis]|uniref:glutaminase A n=1 Tax=Hamadaea tsunoensis TaxID=53368 RepID=UPI000408E915|nr:glutaminase A [Hamadaea tsunoensis]